MRIVLQRVNQAKVTVNGTVSGAVDHGLLLLAGIGKHDDSEDLEWMCRKVLNMRIFDDENGNMNRSVTDVEGGILVVSQFTLHAKTKKGNRPSFVRAAQPEKAEKMYLDFCEMLKQSGLTVETGEFGAKMEVDLTNDGPVTILMDSKNKE